MTTPLCLQLSHSTAEL